MKSFLTLFVFIYLFLLHEDLLAQVENKIEYHFGYAVTDSIAKYYSNKDKSDLQPFIMILENQDEVNRIILLDKPTSNCDTLFFNRTNRFTNIDGLSIRILFEEDYSYGVLRWDNTNLPGLPKRMPAKCIVMRHNYFLIKFDNSGVIWSGYEY